jgi:hypothetical protein
MQRLITDNNVISHLVTVTKHLLQLQVVTNHFLNVTFRDITLYVVNNHLIARTILSLKIFLQDFFKSKLKH